MDREVVRFVLGLQADLISPAGNVGGYHSPQSSRTDIQLHSLRQIVGTYQIGPVLDIVGIGKKNKVIECNLPESNQAAFRKATDP